MHIRKCVEYEYEENNKNGVAYDEFEEGRAKHFSRYKVSSKGGREKHLMYNCVSDYELWYIFAARLAHLLSQGSCPCGSSN